MYLHNMRRINVNIRRFLVRLGKKKILVGIRPYIDGDGIFVLNSGFTGIKDGERFQGIQSLYELARKFDLPVSVYSWSRDEYGTSDGAFWQETGVIIPPEASIEELVSIVESLQSKMNCHCVVLPDGKITPIASVQL